MNRQKEHYLMKWVDWVDHSNYTLRDKSDGEIIESFHKPKKPLTYKDYHLKSKRFIHFKKLKEVCQCSLCGLKTNNLVIDHEHSSRKLRDVLCQNCNHGLGKFKDNPELMRKAAEYVEKHRVTDGLDYYTLKPIKMPVGSPTEPADAFK